MKEKEKSEGYKVVCDNRQARFLYEILETYGLIKVSIALGRGKKLHDKREDLKRRDDQRDMQRAMKRY